MFTSAVMAVSLTSDSARSARSDPHCMTKNVRLLRTFGFNGLMTGAFAFSEMFSGLT
jgi:hypothetical protein